MAPKRRGDPLVDFDFNKSDPEDENFDPSSAAPPRPRKKSRSAKPSRHGRSRRARYRGSDIDDDDEDELEDSELEGSFDEDEDEEEEESPINESTGRRVRKAATNRPMYKESSEDSDEEKSFVEDSDKDELAATPQKTRQQTKIIKLKIPAQSLRQTRRGSRDVSSATKRATRSTTVDPDEDLVELSNSGKHAMPARSSKSRSPETFARNTRATRSGKAPKAPSVIEEATQETSSRGDNSMVKPDLDAMEEDDRDPLAMQDADADADEDAYAEPAVNDEDAAHDDAPMETVEEEDDDDDEDDDVPVKRRSTRARAAIDTEEAPAEEENSSKGRRLTRMSKARQKKSLQEPSSDFDPDDGDDNDSDQMEANEEADEDGESSAGTRGRKGSRGKGRTTRRSQRGGSADGDEAELDEMELAEELEELRTDSRAARRRRRRTPSPAIQYDLGGRKRARKDVNYAIPLLNQVNLEEMEEAEDPAPTPARRRGGRATVAAGWDHSLHTNAGPFGGVGGSGALFSGPFGNGGAEAAGGADSDSSDDEMGQRAGAGGNVGMTPTSAAPRIGFGAGTDPDGGGGLAAPNVGKVKSQKALADADPLGVDLTVDFNSVGGMQGHIEQLKEMVQLPLLYPELFTRFKVTPPRGVLFHGPPGTGKTLLARALANAVGIGGKKITFYMRKGADALSKWVGEAEKQLRLLFEEARKTQPSIIFFDEIDGLAPVRSSKQEQIHASIVSTLLALMDGMDGRGQVIVIGATNRPDNIDPALRRPGRFDREFYFPLPDVDARKSIIDIHTKNWGLDDKFKQSLARETKGYGGADLRAMCTESALNAIQRTYPQIYSAENKLIVDPAKITVQMTDFNISKKKIIPSSERSSASGAAPLPKPVEPLLRDQFGSVTAALDNILPRKKKVTALEEAMWEPYEDSDFGLAREQLQEEIERSRIFRPRLLVCGQLGMGQSYVSSAVLHYFEGVHVQNFDLPTILGDGRPPEQVLVSLFTEVRRHKPSVIFIPNVDSWYASLAGAPMTAFLSMLRSIQPTDPILVLGTAETEREKLEPELIRDIFGFSRRNTTEIGRPSSDNRREYFERIIEHLRRFPKDFPDASHRKRRVLEQLPIAPPPPPRKLTKEEKSNMRIRYRQLLNVLKVHLQPIMDQINRKYKKFRYPVISQAQYQYLFDERDPNYVRPDVAEQVGSRPFEMSTDKDGNPALRETATGKLFYNIDIQTIEERLANGYYTKPAKFLADVRMLEHDAKAIGDRERFLKAAELVSNVEVDVTDIASKFGRVNWDEEYQKYKQLMTEAEEKNRKKQAMSSVVELVQPDVAGGSPSKKGHPAQLHTTQAMFQLIGENTNIGKPSTPQPPNSNGATAPSRNGDDDTVMTDIETQPAGTNAAMQPPSQWPHIDPRSQDTSNRATGGGTTQASQVSAVQSLPIGMSPNQLGNDASAKSSDPSHRSSNWSTQLTNGVQHEQSGSGSQIPDTQPLSLLGSQDISTDDPWAHSQAHALAQGQMQPTRYSSGGSQATSSPANAKSSHVPSNMANLLNDTSDEQSPRHSTASASQQVELDERSALALLDELTARTSGCTIEQLEQINRELTAEVWRLKGENNRMKVHNAVARVFNDAIEDIETTQRVLQASQGY